MSDSTVEQVRIERQLEQTRARMDGRLNELQDRLSPGQVLDDLMGYFRGSAGDDFLRNLLDSVRNNPMPVALTGIGLTWLMAANPHPAPKPAAAGVAGAMTPTASQARPGWKTTSEFDGHFRTIESQVVRQADETEANYRDRVNTAVGGALGLARDAQDTAELFASRVTAALATARDSVADMARNLGDQAMDATHHAADATQKVVEQVSRSVDAARQKTSDMFGDLAGNPVLLGALGVAAGALLGAIVPRGEQEEAALASIAGQAREQVQKLAGEVMDQGGEVARKVLQSGEEGLDAAGLSGKSPGELVDEALSGGLAKSVGNVARDALNAGEDALRERGLGREKPGAGSAGNPPNVAATANNTAR